MQCLWSPRIASVVGTARCSASRRAAVITGPPCSKHTTSRHQTAPRRRTTIGAYLNIPYHRTLSTQAALEPASSPHVYHHFPPTTVKRPAYISQAQPAPPNTAYSPPSPPKTSSAHASRMAAQSIRLCVAQKAFGDAFYIFHAVKYSNDPAFDASAQDLSGYGRDLPRYADVALQFGQTVNPRLAAHALLHSLLRAGQPELAYRFSIKMMEAGVEFHHRSLEGVIKFLSPLPNESPVRHYFRSMVRQYNPTVYLTMRTARFHDNPGADMALQLLEAARRSRHRRTDGMFTHLMKLCILNGELVLVTMLFSALCADWKTARVIQAQVNDMLVPEEIDPTVEATPRDRHHARFIRADASTHRAQLHDILAAVDDTLAAEELESGPASALNAALQALVNLAYLLDNRLLPYTDLGMLIRSIYRCPRVMRYAWIPDPGAEGGYRRVEAYSYCHNVLNRLLNNLPIRRRLDPVPPPPGRPRIQYPREAFEDVMRPLTVRSCNALLHYALRHRLSLKKAEQVLDYMVNKHPDRLKPDTATLNILLRSATLLRRSDIAQQVLEVFRRDDATAFSPAKSTRTTQEHGRSQLAPFQRRRTKFSAALAQLQEDELDIRPLLSPIAPDERTLNVWVTHLTATGNPGEIADAVFDILPQLYLVDHPAGYRRCHDQRLNTDVETRKRDLLQAASYGPQVYVAVLNALVKAGRTGLAERVWLLAKRAERASWQRRKAGTSQPYWKPWCLPIHAYTLMLQCYAGEARRFTLTRTLDIHTGRVSWNPRDKIHVSGWTRYIKGKAVARSLNGRKAARLLYASMYSGAQDVFLKLQKARNVHNRLLGQRPEPDARFFNAALEAFSRPRDRGRPVVSWASKPLSAFAARCQLRSAMQKYDRLQTRPACSRELGQVIADMQKAGYAIPIALRPLLVGRMPVERISWEGITRVDRAPYAFPRRRRSCKRRTHRIPVSKTKGLPLSRMSVGRRMRQRRDTQRS